MEIKNVIICGLGAVGLTYAEKLLGKCELRILADDVRVKRYLKEPPIFNGRVMNFNYITPDDKFDADLIIISTKLSGLEDAISYIKNFLGNNTIIISLLNGITSEDRIISHYGRKNILHSYFIGHSAVRVNNSVTQDGVGKIVFGTPYPENIPAQNSLEQFFKDTGVNYEIPQDIIYSLWQKFTLNVFSNQTSAVLNLNFGEMKNNKNFIQFARKITDEVRRVGEAMGVKNLDKLESDSLEALSGMTDSGKTSMHQDILSGRKTEVDIFAGEIIKLGKRLGIQTPYNQVLYDLIKILEEKNEKAASLLIS